MTPATVRPRPKAALPLPGLTSAEVAGRIAAGQVNDVPVRTSRTVAEIVRANVLTRFNAILGALLVVVAIVGPPQDALFAGVLVSNTAIGIVQEVRAKRTLDRLVLLTAPRVSVRRDGGTVEVARSDVVLDDVIEVTPGDQVVVDGEVVAAEGLDIDESLLTGEAEAVPKRTGDRVLSGSFVAAGTGVYRATRVGADAYAARLAEEARRFSLVRSELRAGIDRILRAVTWLLIPTAALLITTQLLQDEGVADALRGSVAGVGGMIPEGLVLLTSVAFAVGVVRMSRQRVLVQELPALEGLARVDVVCIDKTGTLTDGSLTLHTVEPLGRDEIPAAALGAVAGADPSPNPTLRAIAGAFPVPAPLAARRHVPFSSARKWSAVECDSGTWALGAPEVLLDAIGTDAAISARVESHAAQGRRVLLLAHSGRALPESAAALPAGLAPAALVVLEERVRSDAPATLAYFAEQGVRVVVLSGDHPATVAAVAGRLGLGSSPVAHDARGLPDEAADLADIVETVDVFGRVTPHRKRDVVRALQARGHVVAMTGDGVNDALALKDADIGVAMGSGSPATRGVAQLVLLDDGFAPLPGVVAEGRRVIANVERVANLFLTKTVYAFLLAVATGVAGVPFPFFPRHLTIVSTATIGIPAFLLALAPNARRARPGFVGRVLRFAVPAGTVAAVATFAGYALVRAEPGVTTGEARTVATFVLAGVGLWILSILARPLTRSRLALLWAMAALVAGAFVVPPARRFFSLDLPTTTEALAAVGIVAIAGALLDAGWRASGWFRHRQGARARPDPPRSSRVAPSGLPAPGGSTEAPTGRPPAAAHFETRTAGGSAAGGTA